MCEDSDVQVIDVYCMYRVQNSYSPSIVLDLHAKRYKLTRVLNYRYVLVTQCCILVYNLQDANEIISKFSSLQEEVERRHNQSMQVLHDASYTLTSAQQLRNDTNQVTMQQLQGQCSP